MRRGEAARRAGRSAGRGALELIRRNLPQRLRTGSDDMFAALDWGR